MLSAQPLDDAISRRRAQIAEAEPRRRKLAKYVIGAVSVSLALCLAALAKILFMTPLGAAPAETSARHAEPAPFSSPPALAELATPSNVPAATAAATAASPAAASGEPAATASPSAGPAASAAPVATEPAASARVTPTEDAVRLREASRSALERGSLKTSVEAGESAVALDPTDSEAWLVLGAAYQQMGNLEQARRCFRSCLEKGKGGSRGECAAMLR